MYTLHTATTNICIATIDKFAEISYLKFIFCNNVYQNGYIVTKYYKVWSSVCFVHAQVVTRIYTHLYSIPLIPQSF